MMKDTRRLVLLLSFVACQNEPASAQAAYGEAFAEYANDVCGCEWPIVFTKPLLPDRQYATADDCRADLNVSEDTAKCLEQAPEGNPGAEAALDCLADVLAKAAECLERYPCGDMDRAKCFEVADMNTCSDVAEAQALACIED